MPINLTKIMQQGGALTPKIKFNPHYFQSGLTGRGKTVGLIDHHHDTIKDAFQFASSNPHYLLDPQNHHELIYNSNENMEDDHRLDLLTTRYKLVKTHHFILSPLTALLKTSNLATINYQHRFTTNELPAFIAHLDFQPSIKDGTLGTYIFTDINYYRFNTEKEDNKKEQYFVNYCHAIKFPGKHHDKTNVILNLNQPTDFTSVYNHQPYYDTIMITSPTYFNVNDDISFTKTVSQQAKDAENHLFGDLVKLIKLTWSNPDKLIHQQILTNAYHLIKLQDSRRTSHDYQIFYNQLQTTTLKHHFNRKHQKYNYTKFDFTQLINTNTRLSLTHQLHLLANDHQVQTFTPTQTDLQTQETYSPEQLAVIKTTAPYTVAVAGAGSGKSHTLLGRLSYLKQNNIDFHHVLVTSFTNTAAQNIIDRFHSGINSLTNANLFHQIYQTNFEHTLTNDETLLNLLSILPSNSKLMRNGTTNDTRNQLVDILKRNIANGFQKIDVQNITERLVTLVNHRFTDVITLLNAVHQTSLTLEPIVINAMMQAERPLKYPDALKNLNFILTDESQDTSAFEYVLILQLAYINHAQLMIIGDANQTLYEFRNANPRFLNTLERSDVFKTYTMSTNYRSKQDVLTMANQILDVLSTNQTANIQLHANQFSQVTLDSFKNHVQLTNVIPEHMPKQTLQHETARQACLREAVTTNQKMIDYVLPKLKQHEQIAILTYRNRDAQAIADAVNEIAKANNLNINIAHTRIPSGRPNTWLSNMFSMTDNRSLRHHYLNNQQRLTAQVINQNLVNRLQKVAQYRSRHGKVLPVNNTALSIINAFTNSSTFHQHLSLLNFHKINFNQFMGFVTMKLIQAETRKNNTRDLLENSRDTKWQDADLVISTIHSAKGLEFPHVLCYFDETMRDHASQENLRLYGVALTRAEQSELIINRPQTKMNLTAGQPLPTTVTTDVSGMFKTPMRTAWQRVMSKLHK